MNVIEISHITKDYGSRKGVFDVSLTVKEGEVFGFLGPNGAGKTTTIRQLLGFIRPDAGTVTINGLDCFLDACKIQKTLGYLPGEIAFMEQMKGMEFIRFIAGLKGLKDMKRAEELISLFDLNPSGKIGKMSKGMKQKIGIVCAFMGDPGILILDEPTSGLDPLMQNRFIDLILQEKSRGKTILMSSHIFEEVERTCSRTAIIRQGRLADIADIERLQLGRMRICRICFANEAAARRYRLSRKTASQDGPWVTESISGGMDAFIRDLGSYPVQDLEIRSQTLEELFMHFYGGEAQ